MIRRACGAVVTVTLIVATLMAADSVHGWARTAVAGVYVAGVVWWLHRLTRTDDMRIVTRR